MNYYFMELKANYYKIKYLKYFIDIKVIFDAAKYAYF